ncbi:uncharacterized protein TNCV_605831 [Trichonephila clavipes]|nr:uncharacterized protein TNCV_605831 [Trichonephila clavipes]
MNHYTNSELADIHFIYSLANGNTCVAVWLYGERYPTTWQSNHQTFIQVHQNLVEHRSFRATIDETPVNSEMDLAAQISISTATSHETPGIFDNVHRSVSRLCFRRWFAVSGILYKDTLARNPRCSRRRQIDEADISTPVAVDQRAANYLEEAVRSFTAMQSRCRSSHASVVHCQFI